MIQWSFFFFFTCLFLPLPKLVAVYLFCLMMVCWELPYFTTERTHDQNLTIWLSMPFSVCICISRLKPFCFLSVCAAGKVFKLNLNRIKTVWCLVRYRWSCDLFPQSGVSRAKCELCTGRHPLCDIIRHSVSIYSSTFHSVFITTEIKREELYGSH